MTTPTERDRIVRESWINPKLQLPEEDPRGPAFGVPVLVVVDDMRFRIAPDEKAFVDMATYWPALKRFTITMQCRAAIGAEDVPVDISGWQRMIPLPW